MYLCRRVRKKQLFMYCTSVILFSCAWSFLTLMILVAQEQYSEEQAALEAMSSTTEDSYMGRGIQVVVGHYNGKMPEMNKSNLTFEQLNSQNYEGREGAGELGKPVKLDKTDLQTAEDLFSINQFNLVVSDRIPLNRSLPDMRKKACRTLDYAPDTLPTTSVIIVYHNEAWSTLLRTVTSVYTRAPKHLLTEIILVDDYSNRTFLGDELDAFVATLPVAVKIIRAEQRVGLIRARLMGAEQATGDVLTFLDSHCECTTGWLEPLLHRIQQNRKAVVCPVIDVINDRTFSYQKGIELFRGGFNWNLQFRWYSVPPAEVKKRGKDATAFIPSPTMAGGLFSMDRKYFEELGTYDHQMDIWGGENLEMSFRIWQCGGSVEILPCSHVGHVFRKASPHDFPDNGSSRILNSNLVRVAEVWMDDWKNLFYKTAPQAEKMVQSIDVSDRLELRKHLHCKDFNWYLTNVWPTHFMPQSSLFFGRVELAGSAQCITCTPSEAGKRAHRLKLKKCTMGFDMWQLWIYSADGQIRTDENMCLIASNINKQYFVQIKECGNHDTEWWDYSDYKKQFVHRTSGLCLDEPDPKQKSDEARIPTLKKCGRYSKSQQWTKHEVSWHPKQTIPEDNNDL